MIALYSGTSWISKAIRWQTRSRWSHAAWVMPDGRVYEAYEGHGVRCRRSLLDQYPADTEVQVFDLPLTVTPTTRQTIANLIMGQVGKAYDWWSVARFISRRRADPSDADKWFCSELVFWACQKAGVELLRGIQPWAVSPGLLSLSPLLRAIGRNELHARGLLTDLEREAFWPKLGILPVACGPAISFELFDWPRSAFSLQPSALDH